MSGSSSGAHRIQQLAPTVSIATWVGVALEQSTSGAMRSLNWCKSEHTGRGSEMPTVPRLADTTVSLRVTCTSCQESIATATAATAVNCARRLAATKAVGITTIAAPVFNDRREVVAAVSITVPAQQIAPEQVAVLVPQVQQAASQLTQRISHLPRRGK